jgi:hypothetical protein
LQAACECIHKPEWRSTVPAEYSSAVAAFDAVCDEFSEQKPDFSNRFAVDRRLWALRRDGSLVASAELALEVEPSREELENERCHDRSDRSNVARILREKLNARSVLQLAVAQARGRLLANSRVRAALESRAASINGFTTEADFVPHVVGEPIPERDFSALSAERAAQISQQLSDQRDHLLSLRDEWEAQLHGRTVERPGPLSLGPISRTMYEQSRVSNGYYSECDSQDEEEQCSEVIDETAEGYKGIDIDHRWVDHSSNITAAWRQLQWKQRLAGTEADIVAAYFGQADDLRRSRSAIRDEAGGDFAFPEKKLKLRLTPYVCRFDILVPKLISPTEVNGVCYEPGVVRVSRPQWAVVPQQLHRRLVDDLLDEMRAWNERSERARDASSDRVAPPEAWFFNERDESFDLRRFVADEPTNWLSTGSACLVWADKEARGCERSALASAKAAIDEMVRRVSKAAGVLADLRFQEGADDRTEFDYEHFHSRRSIRVTRL